MSIAVSTIQSLIGQYPLSLFTAHAWYSDYPTNLDLTFGTGSFSGPDLPFGLIFEVHNAPAGIRQLGLEAVKFPHPVARITNNAKILGGYTSSIPVEEFLLDRPRGILLFHEPSTTSIMVDISEPGVFLELWGLYIDIPLVTPVQPAFTPTGITGTGYAGSLDGTAFTGLSGFGAVPMDTGAYGARIDVTTIPASYGREDGLPARLFGVGHVAWINGVGYAQPEFVESQSHVTLAPLGQLTDGLAYSFAAGVEATITCLFQN